MAIEAITGTTVTFNEITKVTSRPEVKVTQEQKPTTHVGKESGELEKRDNNPKRIQEAVDNVNNKMRHAKTKAEFSYHEATRRVAIKLIDEETNEVIKEIPPKEALEMIEKMWELAGMMVDEKR